MGIRGCDGGGCQRPNDSRTKSQRSGDRDSEGGKRDTGSEDRDPNRGTEKKKGQKEKRHLQGRESGGGEEKDTGREVVREQEQGGQKGKMNGQRRGWGVEIGRGEWRTETQRRQRVGGNRDPESGRQGPRTRGTATQRRGRLARRGGEGVVEVRDTKRTDRDREGTEAQR